MTVDCLQEKVPLAWVNQSLFDYQDHLRSGTVTLPCWNVNPEEPLEDLLNPIGQNTNTMYMYMGRAWASPTYICTPYSIVYGVTVTLCIYIMRPILVIKHRSKHQLNLVPRLFPPRLHSADAWSLQSAKFISLSAFSLMIISSADVLPAHSFQAQAHPITGLAWL